MKLACNLQCCEKKKKKTYENVGFVILLESFYSKKKNKIKEDPMWLLYIYCGRKLSLGPNQVLFALGWAGSTLAPTRMNLLNLISGRNAFYPCLISLEPKEGCIVVCVVGAKVDPVHPKANNIWLGSRLSFLPDF